jgi:hypothetical protein
MLSMLGILYSRFVSAGEAGVQLKKASASTRAVIRIQSPIVRVYYCPLVVSPLRLRGFGLA